MVDAFMFFVLGVVTMRVLQFLLGIVPNYYIFKQAEYSAFRILADVHLQKLTVMKIIEACYFDTGRGDEFLAIQNEVNKRYNDIISKCIERIKTSLPYKTTYNNLQEAIETLIEEKRNEHQR